MTDPLPAEAGIKFTRTVSLRKINLLLSLVGAIVLFLIIAGFYNGERLHDLNSPLMTAVSAIRLETDAVRIGIGDFLNDEDKELPANIWVHLDQSVWFFENLLDSGDHLFNQLIPIRNQEIRNQCDDLILRFTVIKDYAGLKAWGSPGKKKNIDSVLPQFDRLFSDFLQQLDTLDSSIAQVMNKDQLFFRIIHTTLFLLCIVLVVVVRLMIQRYERHRTAHLTELKETNEQLQREVVERKRTEQALQESERLFRTIFETIPDSIIISRLQDNSIVDVNNGFLELTGFGKNEVIGKTALDLTLWEDTEKRDRFIAILESRRYIHNFESRFRMKDGQVQTALISVNVIDLNGEPHFITVARNIDELKKADNALRESEAKFRGLFETAGDHIHLLDLEGRVLLSNPAGLRNLGYSAEEIQGRRLTDFVAKGSRGHFDQFFSGLTANGCLNCEVEMVSKGGRRIAVDSSASVIREVAGTIGCIVLFQKDITDRKSAEQKRQAAHDFLLIANRHTDLQSMLADFIATIKKLTGCQAAAIRILDEDGNIPYACEEGFGAEFCEVENFLSVKKDQGICVRVVRNDVDPGLPNFTEFGTYLINDYQKIANGNEKSPEHCLRNACNRFGYRSLTLIPIRLGKQTLGLIHAADRRKNIFTVEIVETLEAAALQVGATIQRLRAEEALKVAYQKLEDRVMERTVELSLANENLRSEIDVRRQVEEHLRESRNMLQSLIDGITDALILLDCDMRIRMINRGAAEYYEITSYEEVIDKQCFNAVGTVGACTDCEIPQAVKRGQTLVFERTGLTDDKKLEKVSVYPIREKDGEISGAIVRISDITEEKRIERQLIQSEKMASLGILVTSIAHEINNPNSFITFNIPILREYLAELIGIADEYAEKHRDFELFHMSYPEFRKDVSSLVDNIEHGASRISTFVDNLREFSHGNKDRRRAWLKLPSVVDKVLSICRSQIKKRIKNFEVVIPDDLAPIYAEEYSLEQVLINLIMNAVQAADKKSSAVKLTAANGNTWRDYTIIEVTDNGCGMDPKTISAIFTPFFTTKQPTEGTGLGLYVCHNLVKNLGGRIEVESKPGEGSTFSVYLPDKDRRLEPRP